MQDLFLPQIKIEFQISNLSFKLTKQTDSLNICHKNNSPF